MLRCFSILTAVIILASTSSAAFAGKVFKSTQQGDPKIQSINTLSFAPGGVLLIGDGRGAQVVAVDTGEKAGSFQAFKQVSDLGRQLAARIGVEANGIEILDMAVSPHSQSAYIAVRKQDDKRHIVFTVTPQGQIDLLDLTNVRFASVRLASGEATVSLVTDVAWADSQIVAAARSNEAFASKIFSIPVPLQF